MIRTSLLACAILASAAVVAACGTTPAATRPSAAPSVTPERATEIAKNALEGYNAGDYAMWSRDWSDTMKAALPSDVFERFRHQALATNGRYVAIDGVELTSVKPGTFRYVFTVRFEKRTATVGFGYQDGGTLVEGVHFQ